MLDQFTHPALFSAAPAALSAAARGLFVLQSLGLALASTTVGYRASRGCTWRGTDEPGPADAERQWRGVLTTVSVLAAVVGSVANPALGWPRAAVGLAFALATLAVGDAAWRAADRLYWGYTRTLARLRLPPPRTTPDFGTALGWTVGAALGSRVTRR